MKRIVASVSLVAVGVSGVYAASPLMGPDASKNWSVSATLRGFYDDNPTTTTMNEQESWGFDVSPALRYTLPLEQTYFGLGYMYRARYYDNRDSDNWDQSHQADLQLRHAFSERYSVDVKDTFVIAQEPEVLEGGVPFRTNGDNLRNQARVTFNAEMTRQLSWTFGYNNVLWDYEQDFSDSAPFASLSGLLDRVEHLGLVNLNWQVSPETTALIGYNFGVVQYTGDEAIFAGPVMSSDRDNQSHYIYGGLNQNFLRNLSASIKLGATYIDYDNDVLNDDNWIPYVDISGAFTYARGSYLQVGAVHSFNATDVIAPAGGKITSSQQSTTIYGVLHHQITPKLVGSLTGRFQDSEFENGLYGGQHDQYVALGVNLTYQITRHFSCEAGYNFDNLESDIPSRPYDRNRVYVGLTAGF